jgi:hypothetical protein
MRQCKAIVFIIILLISGTPLAHACTIFTDAQGDNVLFAGNEDQSPNESYLLVDTEGPIGVVYLATPWQELPLIPQMGMNMHGLCYDTNWIPSEALNMGPDFTTLDDWPVPHLMRECSTVEEVLDRIFEYNWGSSISYQMHFADASGDAVVIHPGADGVLTYTRKQTGDGYLVSTNFNLERLKTGDYHCERYSTATSMLSAEHTLSVDFMASILDATHADGQVSTIFSSVFDPMMGEIHLYYNHRFDQPLILDMQEELSGGAKQVPLDELFEDTESSGLLEYDAPVVFLVIVLAGLLIYHRRRAM